MGIQKNFVIKNGLEVNNDLIFADKDLNKVGIGTTNVSRKLEVVGGVGADNIIVSGIATLNNLKLDGYLNVGNSTGNSGDILVSTGTGVTWTGYNAFRTKLSTQADPGDTTFSLPYTVGFVDVFVNGLRLTESEYTATDGSTIILSEPCFGGEKIDIFSYNAAVSGIITATGSVRISTNDDLIGLAEEINFKGAGITTVTVLSGIATVQIDGSGSYWFQNVSGISTTSNVGIGTTDPSEKLHVVGNTLVNGDITADNYTGRLNGTDNYNFFGGIGAGNSNTTGSDNIFIGYYAGGYNTTGSKNIILGQESGYCNTVGNNNIFFGCAAGNYNAGGSNNLFFGSYTGVSTSASYKVIFGSGSSYGNGLFDSPDTNKDQQFAVGLNTDGNGSKYWLVGNENFNIGIGETNPTSKLTINGNIGFTTNINIGNEYTGLNNTNDSNIFIGKDSGSNNTGSNNVVVGNVSGYNASGGGNIILGAYANFSNQETDSSILLYSGSNLQSGSNAVANIFIGSDEIAQSNTTGSYNIFFGRSAGEGNTTGSHNIFIGNNVGMEDPYTEQGSESSYKIIIGQGAEDLVPGYYYFNTPAPEKDKQLAIGLNTTGNPEYWLVGDENMNIGIGTTNPQGRLHVDSGFVRIGTVLELPDYGNTGFNGTVGIATADGYLAGTSNFISLSKTGQRITTTSSSGTVTTIPYGILGPVGVASTIPDFNDNDDGYWELTCPFNIEFTGITTDKIYVGTNSYITFTGGSDDYSNLDGSNPPLPKIMVGSGDRRSSGIYYDTYGTSPNRAFYVRYEGARYYDVYGTQNLLWEATFYEDTPSQIDIQIENNPLNQSVTSEKAKLQLGGPISFSEGNILIGDATTGCSLQGNSAYGNTLIGIGAGSRMEGGYNNIFMGPFAGNDNQSGSYNNFFGYYAGFSNASGCYNNFFGYYAGLNNDGDCNNFIGYCAGHYNTTGFDNIFLGTYSGYYNTTGYNNNFIGCYAGCCNTIGSDNNFLGTGAGSYNREGSYNNFFGYYSGCYNTTGCYNDFIGYFAGSENISGTRNVSIGAYTYGATTGSGNFLGGYAAGYAGMNGSSYNNFIGYYSGGYGDQGESCCNNFIGYFAGGYNSNSCHNNFFGTCAGYYNTGSYNNFIGYYTGYLNSTGSNNIFLGTRVGISTNSSYKIILGQGNAGYDFDSPSITKDKQFAVGLNTTGNSEYWIVGDENMNIGIGVTNPTTKLQVGGTVTADAFVGVGSDLTNLDASQLTSGTVPAARITASGGDFTVGSNLYVNGNVSIGGTSVILNSQQLEIKDRDIVVGILTDGNNNDISNDNTANHGGIAVASTVGSPILNIPLQVGVNSNPSTYKQIMWIKEGNYSGMGTDAWVFNYAVSIGNTSSVQYGSRLTVGAGFTVYDDYVDVSNINVSGVSTLGNVQISSGIVTATTGIITYYGDGSNLINLPGGGLSAIGIQSGGVNVGSAGTINFVGLGISSITVSSGIATINIPGTVKTYVTYTATSNQTTFAAFYNAGNVDVFMNGSRLSNNSYTATNGTSIVLNEGASSGDEIEIIGYYSYDVFNSYANYAQNLIGTPNINAGVVTATTYYGNGTNLAGIHNVGVVTYTSQVAITTYNALTSRVFEHNNVFTLASWTANFQNLNLDNNQATTVRIIGSTGNAESSLTAVQIDGTSSGVITYNLPMKFTKNKNGILQLLIVKGATGANYEVYGESTNLF